MTPNRRVYNLSSLLVLLLANPGVFWGIFGCGQSPDRFLILQHAITTTHLQVQQLPEDSTEDAKPAVSHFRGTVSSHTTATTAGLAKFAVDGADPTQNIQRTEIRYFLPDGQRIPVEVGDTISLQIFYHRDPQFHNNASILVADQNGEVIVAWNNGVTLPPESIAHLIVVVPTWKLSYQEAGREDGFCEHWRDHGVVYAEFQVGDAQPHQRELSPGQSVQFSSPFGNYLFWLLELSTTKRTTCSEHQNDRFSYVLIRR